VYLRWSVSAGKRVRNNTTVLQSVVLLLFLLLRYAGMRSVPQCLHLWLAA
jgi:hypothetical protein